MGGFGPGKNPQAILENAVPGCVRLSGVSGSPQRPAVPAAPAGAAAGSPPRQTAGPRCWDGGLSRGGWPRRRGGCGGRWRREPWRVWRGEAPGPGPRAPGPRGGRAEGAEAPAAPRLLTGGGVPGARRAQEAACDEACQKRSAQAQIYFVSALMLVILACGLACAANIRTPDRFDTPKESQD